MRSLPWCDAVPETSLACAGGKLLFCGNGGSAADAQHLATEMLIRLRSGSHRTSVPVSRPALALAIGSGHADCLRQRLWL